MIREDHIDAVIHRLEIEDNLFDKFFSNFKNQQEAFVQFIATDNFKLLKEEEFELLVFVLVVIHESVSAQREAQSIDPDLLQKYDEANWLIYNDENSKNFKNVLDKFFDQYEEEDLLAFVEDSLVDSDELALSQTGREIIFITSKTFIDCLKN